MNEWDVGGIFIAVGCAIMVGVLIIGHESVFWKDDDE